MPLSHKCVLKHAYVVAGIHVNPCLIGIMSEQKIMDGKLDGDHDLCRSHYGKKEFWHHWLCNVFITTSRILIHYLKSVLYGLLGIYKYQSMSTVFH